MHPFPHLYRVRVAIAPEGEVSLESEGLARIHSLPPPEWGGPGGYWSPETLLTAAVGDCVLLTFRAIAKASRLAWREASADVEGKLERADGNSRFTEITIRVRLVVPAGWQQPEPQQVTLAPLAEAVVRVTLAVGSEPARRARVAADVAVGGTLFGQQAEALVDVE